jgi:hypothetical protein
VWNLLGDRSGKSWWVPGALGLGVGISQSTVATYGALNNDNDNPDITGASIGINAAVGLISGIVGIRTLSLGRSTPTPTGNSERSEAALSLMPWTPKGTTVGVRMDIRF